MKAICLPGMLLLASACLFSSCNQTPLIYIDGSSTVFPITAAVAEEYRNINPRAKLMVGISGTGGGFKKFSEGETVITNASRPIKEKEAATSKKNNISYLELSVALDGLAVIVNPENDWMKDVTVAELKKIWEPEAQGKIMRWNQVRPEWPDAEMHLFGPGVASGTFDYFTEVIMGKSGKSRGDYTASEDDNVLVQGVKNDKYGLGFFGLAFFEENKDKLKLVAVDSGNGPVLPTLETVQNGAYSPLARPLFIYVNSVAGSRPEVIQFMHFYLSKASQLASEVGYVALSPEEYAQQTEKFNAFIHEFAQQ